MKKVPFFLQLILAKRSIYAQNEIFTKKMIKK